jgi:hypothetical protein
MAKKKSSAIDATFAALRKQGLSYSETREDHPWGHTALKVKDKIFLTLAREEGGLSLSLKLPQSRNSRWNIPSPSPPAMAWARAAG